MLRLPAGRWAPSVGGRPHGRHPHTPLCRLAEEGGIQPRTPLLGRLTASKQRRVAIKFLTYIVSVSAGVGRCFWFVSVERLLPWMLT